ncbi:MAG: tRNA lysidine(34) synthetase TilS, partial [Alphaproteobacteria bacterium]|nr:tRNA lysidine(34) synthetase TilS [Alphaproteobacteria bacterium]
MPSTSASAAAEPADETGPPPPRPAAPLSLAEFDAALAALGGFEPEPLLAVGVSGGPDSVALAILADRWARARGGVAWGLVVDHGLRPDSTAEAEIAAGWLAARGIPPAVLCWTGAKPLSGIQEAARAARYRLLAGWCAARGCLHLLLAHHRDDQTETYLIRRRAGSGVDGLAAMPAIRELPQLRIVRPLLGVPKARLIAFLKAENQPYVEDPSNRNPVFERARLRIAQAAAVHPGSRPASGARVASGSGPGEGQPQLARHILAHATARMAREQALAALLARAAALHPAGFAVLDAALLVAAGELGERALDRIAAVIGGAGYPLRRQRLARLREALGAAPLRGRTLG